MDTRLAELPPDALVVLVGPSGSGKTTFARQNFTPTQVLASDDFRAMVSDDAADQGATADAFRILHAVVRARLRRRLLTVVDATNIRFSARQPLLASAARHRRPAVAIALDVSLETCLARNAGRTDRPVPPAVVREHHQLFRRALAHLADEGFSDVIVIAEG